MFPLQRTGTNLVYIYTHSLTNKRCMYVFAFLAFCFSKKLVGKPRSDVFIWKGFKNRKKVKSGGYTSVPSKFNRSTHQ
jgi:hypothetical protein